MNAIELSHVTKQYTSFERAADAGSGLRALFSRTTRIVEAVSDLSFTIEEGETVGFIGENGAGKSTTIKMMSGILYPTAGSVSVCGLVPYTSRKQNAMNIGVIFGQKSRLLWDLPMEDSFALFKEIYKIEPQRFKRNVDFFMDMLELHPMRNTPVRQLSLGQRMKVEIALAMLHDPRVLFLDEPTIGLDVLAKRNIRDFIVRRNRLEGVTTILTSHDMKDLDSVCSRVVMITKGRLFFDGSMASFKKRFAGRSMVEVCFEGEEGSAAVLDALPVEYAWEENKLTILYDEGEIKLPVILERLSADNTLESIRTREPDIEDMVRNLYIINGAEQGREGCS